MISGYLLDTSSISMLAPGRSPIPYRITRAIRDRSGLVYLPTIAIAEIGAGIARLRRIGSQDRAEKLTVWISAIRIHFEDRVIPFDLAAADATAEIADRATGIECIPVLPTPRSPEPPPPES